MPIVIKKASGEVKTVDSPDLPAPTAVLTDEGRDWVYKPVPEAIDMFCGQLALMQASEMGMKTDCFIAAYLGFGSLKAHTSLANNVFDPEWPKIIPWFTRPDVGDWILPPNATWEIHRTATDEGKAGWATLEINGEVFQAKARTPWAAFAICLLQARKVGAFVVTRTKGQDP